MPRFGPARKLSIAPLPMLALVGSTVLAGCGGGTEEQSPQSDPASASSGEVVGATDPCSCAADTLCPAIEFICCSGEACVPGAGLLLSAADALEVGRALFENRARR